MTELTLNISAVERDTGLSKDTLRMWERRYGFPEPLRDTNGERIYPLHQVEKLRLIKRLMDRGHRPGKIMSRRIDDLMALGSLPDDSPQASSDLQGFIALIKLHQLPELRRLLAQTLMKQGLQRFVLDTVAPLNIAVGDAWMRGDFQVFEEHLYTEQVQAILRSALTSNQSQGRAPRVLLTSLPTEPHGLGLLMVEALLIMEGASCVPLGTETPCGEIALAAQAHQVDIVALSFSAAFNERQAAAGLAELREQLPESIPIWAGGAAVTRIRKPPHGVELIRELDEVADKLAQWRMQHATV